MSSVLATGPVAAASQAACTDATSVGAQAQAQAKGGALNTVNSIVGYVNSVCSSADKVAAAATNPSTVQWVGQLAGELQAIVNPPSAS